MTIEAQTLDTTQEYELIPKKIHAVKVTLENIDEVAAQFNGEICYLGGYRYIFLPALANNTLGVMIGQYLVQDIDGRLRYYSEATFMAKFHKVA